MKALASHVYPKQEINDKSIIYTNSLNTQSDKVNTYLKPDVDVVIYIYIYIYIYYKLGLIDEF